MDKHTFIDAIKADFKSSGYIKKGNYWHKKPGNGLIYSVMVSGSQWNKNDYYIEMGITEFSENNPFPTEMNWTLFKRCVFDGRQTNLLPDEAIVEIRSFFNTVKSISELRALLHSDRVRKVWNRWVLFCD